MEGAFSASNEILDISAPRSVQAHTSAMGHMRCYMNQLALTMPPEPGSDTISFLTCRFRVSFWKTRLLICVSNISFYNVSFFRSSF